MGIKLTIPHHSLVMEPSISDIHTPGKIRGDGMGKIGLIVLGLYLLGIAEFLNWIFHT